MDVKTKAIGLGANEAAHLVLQFFAIEFSKVKKNREYLRTKDGWLNFPIGLTTEDGSVCQSIWFEDGNATVKRTVEGVDTKLTLQDTGVLAQLAVLPPNEVLNLLLKNKMIANGNFAYLQMFNFMISILMGGGQIKKMRAQKEERAETGKTYVANPEDAKRKRPEPEFLKVPCVDPGVKYLQDDCYLSTYSMKNFPRLRKFLDVHHQKTPELCIERAKIITDFFRANGFERKPDGTPWVPEERQALMFKYLMEHRKPIIRKDDLVAGTTTTKEIGVPIYPDGVGTMMWAELKTVHERMLQPYGPISEEDMWTLRSE